MGGSQPSVYGLSPLALGRLVRMYTRWMVAAGVGEDGISETEWKLGKLEHGREAASAKLRRWKGQRAALDAEAWRKSTCAL